MADAQTTSHAAVEARALAHEHEMARIDGERAAARRELRGVAEADAELARAKALCLDGIDEELARSGASASLLARMGEVQAAFARASASAAEAQEAAEGVLRALDEEERGEAAAYRRGPDGLGGPAAGDAARRAGVA